MKEKKSGYKSILYCLADQIKQMYYFKDKFEKKEIDFIPLSFRGEYHGASYPNSYIEREKGAINISYEALKRGEKIWVESYLLSLRAKDRLCKARKIFMQIEPDGMAHRCSGPKFNNNLLGNLFDDNFKLLDKLSFCIKAYC